MLTATYHICEKDVSDSLREELREYGWANFEDWGHFQRWLKLMLNTFDVELHEIKEWP